MNFRQVHLDFHTSEKIPDIGENFDKQRFQEALITGHVNSITVFSKCHHGWAYHPSKANEMHPNLKFDLLAAQIEAAHEIGVKTPVYLSAGHDEKIAVRHPEWIVREKNMFVSREELFSKPGYHRLCMNTAYLDYLLEQIKEVCSNYDADGIFLDIVGVTPCYCEKCMQTLRAEGKNPEDEKEVWNLAERVYANYTRKCREVIDSVKHGLPVFHNGGHIRCGRRDLAKMNTHLELESLPTGVYGYDHFPLSARYVQQTGMEYLGMTGKFHEEWGEFGGFKHPNALRYEVSLAAANGAKSSIGDQLHPCGEMDMATYQLIGEAYRELEKKEEWLDHVESIADIAFFSTEAYQVILDKLQVGMNTKVDAGVLRILQEGKYLFDVIDMESDLSKYKLLILPDIVRVTEKMKQKVDAFLENGGKVLATGKSGLYCEEDTFAFDFGVKYLGSSEYQPNYLRPLFKMNGLYESSYVMYYESEIVKLSSGIEHGKQEKPYFNRTAEHFCSHRHAPVSGEESGTGIAEGKDGIYIAWQVFTEYAEKGTLISKRIVEFALDRLLNTSKTLNTNLGAQGIVTLMHQKQENRYVNHILYVTPVKRGNGIEVVEDIVPVYDIRVAVKVPEKIRSVYLAPQKMEIPFVQENDVVSFTVKKVECHQMIVLEY